jgi:hypothetical protein
MAGMLTVKTVSGDGNVHDTVRRRDSAVWRGVAHHLDATILGMTEGVWPKQIRFR